MLSPTRFLIPVVLGLALTSCSDSLSVTVQRVQDKTVEICSYMPTSQSVLDILKAGGPTTQVPFAIATAICDAVLQWQQANRMKTAIAQDCPRVNGVCVEGTFVDKDEKEKDSKEN